ncbi:MAG: oligosaccharide flippase family protein [Sulfolobales archaeon]|nr:oligosaccharide flippase family protein [Sulfolobales archaeon]MDW7969045.1 oligosaccharide flippase family protein [Sulfolobales archaeon]
MNEKSRSFSVSMIVRGGFWLYAGSIIDNFSGFLYWMLVSTLVGPTAIGIASTISSLSGLILTFLSLGISTGAIRFFGMFYGSDEGDKLNTYFWSTYVFNLLTHVVAGVLLLLLGIGGHEFGGISSYMLIFASFMVIAGLGTIPSSLITSMLKTEVLFISTVLSILFRFTVGIVLISNYGLGWIGAVIGNLTQLYVRLAVINFYAVKEVPPKLSLSYKAIADTLIAGMPSWLPTFITSIGSLLGVLSVYVISGALETGYYYVSSAIANVVLMVGTSILSLTFPVLSGMADGRKRALTQVMKVSIALITPPSIYVMIYSWLPLSWLGRDYVNSAPILTTLLISAIPSAITSGVVSLTYAYGKYSLVLAINVVSSFVRMVLYYVLIPYYGGLGSAIASTVGSFAGFLATLYVAKIIGFTLGWRLLAETVAIPLMLGGISFALNVHWLIALAVTTSSYILYLKLRIVGKDELKEIVKALRMESLAIKIYSKYGDIINKILGY